MRTDLQPIGLDLSMLIDVIVVKIEYLKDVEGFDMANLMWVPRGVVIRRSFADQMNDIFQTKVREADFRRFDLVRSFINRRIGDVTHGKIQDFLPPGLFPLNINLTLNTSIWFEGYCKYVQIL